MTDDADDPLPGDRRGAARPDRGGRRRLTCCPSESELSAEFGVSRVTVRRALETPPRRRPGRVAPGLRVVLADRAGAQRLDAAGDDRAQLEDVGHRIRSGRSSSSPSWPRRRTSPSELRCRPGAAGEAGQPRRRRAVRGRHGVVPGRARSAPVAAATSSGARSTSCSASRCAARRRRSAPTRPSAEDAALLEVPVGAPGAAVRAGHHRHRRPTGAAQRAHLPGPPHRVRGRPSQRSAERHPDRPAPGRIAGGRLAGGRRLTRVGRRSRPAPRR